MKVPPFFHIENSYKNSIIQQRFIPFNLAPKDDVKFKNADYRNGCSNLTECGIALTALGYYPCSLAGGIDRILGNKLGIESLPIDAEQLSNLLPHFCRSRSLRASQTLALRYSLHRLPLHYPRSCIL